MLDLSPTSRAHCLNLTPEDVKATLERDLVPDWRPLLTDAGLPWRDEPERRSRAFLGCSVASVRPVRREDVRVEALPVTVKTYITPHREG